MAAQVFPNSSSAPSASLGVQDVLCEQGLTIHDTDLRGALEGVTNHKAPPLSAALSWLPLTMPLWLPPQPSSGLLKESQKRAVEAPLLPPELLSEKRGGEPRHSSPNHVASYESSQGNKNWWGMAVPSPVCCPYAEHSWKSGACWEENGFFCLTRSVQCLVQRPVLNPVELLLTFNTLGVQCRP